MSIRRAASLSLAFALAISLDSYPADADKRILSKAGGGESAGMYSNYADDGSVVSRKYLGNAGVDVLTEAELMPALVSALYQISKYHRLVATPEVIRVPHERIEAIVCNAKCAALAVYRPGEGIYLDEQLKPETNLFDRSVLLHELVHYVQDMSDEHGDMRPCMRWYQREQEAYAIQKIFLFMTGSPTRVGYSAHKSTCDDDKPQ
ncbi:MAG: hypothetical protein HY067_05820 [Betaproteobacteria bacterium]|nr:hypothetical protein [Betaproteobacteria bacterium]